MSNQIVKALEHGAQKLGRTLAEDAGKALKNFYRKAGDNLKKVAHNTREADAQHARDLEKILKGDGKGSVPHPRSGGRDRPGRPGGPGRPGQRSEGNRKCRKAGDPVDVVSGQMIASYTDLELPGLLPLVISRSYASGYRLGRGFGPGWSSTLDQRVEMDDSAIHYVGDDAQVLYYPRPSHSGQTVLPVDGLRWPLRWDQESDLVLIEDPGTGWTRHFPAAPDADGSRLLAAITDRAGHRIDFHYDYAGVPTEIRHSGGFRIAVDAAPGTAGSRVAALRLLDGSHAGLGTTIASYEYDGSGRLVAIADRTGKSLVLTHDGEDRITSWTDRNGYTYGYTYGTDGRVVAGRGSDGSLTAVFDYDAADRVTTVTDGLGRRTRFHFDENNHVTQVVDGLGHSTATRYDRYGRMLAQIDAHGNATRYTLDDHGDVVRVERPDGTSVSVRYNALRLPVHAQAPDGRAWNYDYDRFGNLTEYRDPTGATTRFGYDDAGHPSSVTDALGHTTAIRCDAAGRVVELVDPVGGRTTVEYDAFGQPAVVTDALGQVTTTVWTPTGLPVSRSTPDGTTERWTYDDEGNPVGHHDRAGAVTAMEYGGFGVLAARTGPDGARYQFAYDSELRLTEVTNPVGQRWQYGYDAAGRLVSETDFNGRTLAYIVDAVGRPVSRTNGAGQSVHYAYDAVGNLVSKNADGAVTTFTYDRVGRLVGAEGPDGRMEREYDELGRLTAESVDGRVSRFSYDALGRRVDRRTPSQHVSSWTYDAVGNPLTLNSAGHQVAFAHDALGRELERRTGTSLVMASVWDGADRLVEQSLARAGGLPLQRTRYSYRADDVPLSATDHRGRSRRWDADAAGRVTAVDSVSWSERYAYDPLGNVTSASWPGSDEAAHGDRVYQGTLIRSAGRVRYEHDLQGRMTVRRQATLSGRTSTWSYEWDAEDRLTAVTTPDGTRWRYRYDVLGRRTAKQRLEADGQRVVEWTEFTWDGTLLVEQTAHGPALPGPYTLTWDHDGLQPVAQSERIGSAPADAGQAEVDRRFFAIVTDLVGTPVQLLAPDGSTAWQARSSLWGVTSYPKDSSTYTPLRFPGQYYDPESRLHYNLHRYYDPETARFASPDPLGLDADPNHHAFVSNPLVWVDPLGLAAKKPKRPKGQFGAPIGLGEGFTGRLDKFDHGHGQDFEIHVYRNGEEFGLFGSNGWFYKHGTGGGAVPPSVENRLKGKAVKFMRGSGRLGKLGTENIKGDRWKRPRLGSEECDT
ncbi:DUF6531 domain-containing protein [Kitasatospora sp. NPDC094015]|uniref:DUF6531 domain-containing protein n=1 Tax=Kitasatospora sp. NPDC094015 TaxID=3155205 RepID=UPI003321CA26